MNRKLDVSLVMEYAWGIFKAHWVMLSVFALAVMFVTVCVSLLNPYQVPAGLQGEELLMWYLENGTGYYAWSFLAAGVQVVLMAWFYNEVFKRIKGVELVLNAGVVLRYLAVSIIVGIATYVSALCCLIPVFFIAPRLLIAPLYVIDNPNMGVGEAIERSWKATQGNVITLLVLGVIAFLISLLGVCCCCVGVVPASVLCYLIMVTIYLFLTGQVGEDTDAEAQEEVSFVVEEKTVVRD